VNKLKRRDGTMLPDYYAGKYSFTNEVLYEGDIADLMEKDYEIRKINNCCIYDISYKTLENPDHIEQEMNFTAEVICAVIDKDSQETRMISRKINAVKNFIISKSIIKKQTAEASDNYYVIQHVKNIAFYTQTTNSGSSYITITADIEGLILREPHQDFWICDRIDMAPPQDEEVQDWKQLLDSISIKDTVSLFENFLQLVKGVCNNDSSDSVKEEKKKLEQENRKLTDEINQLKMSINNLRSEINNQSYIINGLLKIIKPL